MARTSSAKKIARLAEKGKGKKVRFQGGSVFPTIVLSVLILGAVLIAYARQSGTVVDASVTAEQKFATAFAFFNCDALATDLDQPDAATLSPTDKFAAVTTETPAAIIGDGDSDSFFGGGRPSAPQSQSQSQNQSQVLVLRCGQSIVTDQ